MCGIIGILSSQQVQDRLVTALETLEYRGYDSAGIAIAEEGKIIRRRALGKLINLKDLLQREPLSGVSGIGHIRWATHGRPTVDNSHPHSSKQVTLIHNGIIENHEELRQRLEAQGYRHVTQTDSEVVAHLIQSYLDQDFSPLQAVQKSLNEVRGAYALAIMFQDHQDYMIAARHGAPLLLGQAKGEMHIGSDALCLVGLADHICYLEDGDIAELTSHCFKVFDFMGHEQSRAFIPLDPSIKTGTSKEGYPHFMLKEIYEQPDAIQRTIAHYLKEDGSLSLPELGLDPQDISKIVIIACGTSYYAGMVAKYWLEQLARIPVELDIASEYRYRQSPLPQGTLAIFISQSGETADTLAAHQFVKKQNIPTIAIVNVKTSSLAREANTVLQTLAGPEIGVASTKAFTNQLLVLSLLALQLAKERQSISESQLEDLHQSLISVPDQIRLALQQNETILTLSKELSTATSTLFLGRGTSFPIALEGALKLKEISYIHAEAYAAGEMKHGPIALIDEHMPVIVLAPHDALFEKTLSNMEEVMARNGKVILVSDKKGIVNAPADLPHIELPETDTLLAPFVYSIAMQLLAYHTANRRGADVDQPRNLAKSVTVE